MPPKKKAPPTEPTETTTTTPSLAGRVIAPMQSAGRMGKSTFVDLYLGWLDHAGVAWRGLDFDGVHKTLSRAYENVHLMPLSDPEAMPQLLHALSTEEPVPVTALDFPAQATDDLLRDFERVSALEVLNSVNLRLTVPLFLVDDQAARESLAKVVRALGTEVDYILIRNPAKGPSSRVEATPAVAEMLAHGTPVVNLPVLTEVTRDAIATASRQAKTFFPLSTVKDTLPTMPRLELEKFLSRVWAQMEDAASVLLPNPALIANRVSAARDARKGASAGEEFDPFNV